LPPGKGLLNFQNFCFLEVADLGGEFIQGAGRNGQGGQDFGVAVPLKDLSRDRSRFQAQFSESDFFHPGIKMAEGAHSSGDAAITDGLSRLFYSLDVSFGFFIPNKKLEAEGDRFGVNAVGATDHDGFFVLKSLLPKDTFEGLQLSQNFTEEIL